MRFTNVIYEIIIYAIIHRPDGPWTTTLSSTALNNCHHSLMGSSIIILRNAGWGGGLDRCYTLLRGGGGAVLVLRSDG